MHLVHFSSLSAKPRGRDQLRFLCLLCPWQPRGQDTNFKLHIPLLFSWSPSPWLWAESSLSPHFAEVTQEGTQGGDSPRVTLPTRVFEKYWGSPTLYVSFQRHKARKLSLTKVKQDSVLLLKELHFFIYFVSHFLPQLLSVPVDIFSALVRGLVTIP